MVMCAGAVVLSVLFFGAAALLGYTDLPQRAPELSVFVIAVNLSLPMAAWMRFRGMQWQPTLEMAGSTMVVGLLLIAAYWAGFVAKDSLIEIQTGPGLPGDGRRDAGAVPSLLGRPHSPSRSSGLTDSAESGGDNHDHDQTGGGRVLGQEAGRGHRRLAERGQPRRQLRVPAAA
jgi:hypothetical protein